MTQQNQSNTTQAKDGKPSKSLVSKERILEAARAVFSRYPYQEASMRMIGAEGGFEHPLIHYYFPTKAALFEAVMNGIVLDLLEANTQWYEGMDGSDPEGDLTEHVIRLLAYYKEHPEPFRVLFLNISQVHMLKDIPGIQLIPGIIAGTRLALEQHIKLYGSDEEIGMLNSAFCNMVIWYLGANHCQAMVLEMDPDGDEYLEWVKNTLIAVFLPWARKLLSPK